MKKGRPGSVVASARGTPRQRFKGGGGEGKEGKLYRAETPHLQKGGSRPAQMTPLPRKGGEGGKKKGRYIRSKDRERPITGGQEEENSRADKDSPPC